MAIMEASPTQESDLFKGVSNRVIEEISREATEVVSRRTLLYSR